MMSFTYHCVQKQSYDKSDDRGPLWLDSIFTTCRVLAGRKASNQLTTLPRIDHSIDLQLLDQSTVGTVSKVYDIQPISLLQHLYPLCKSLVGQTRLAFQKSKLVLVDDAVFILQLDRALSLRWLLPGSCMIYMLDWPDGSFQSFSQTDVAMACFPCVGIWPVSND